MPPAPDTTLSPTSSTEPKRFASKRDALRLQSLGWFALGAFILWQWIESPLENEGLIALGCLISLLAAWPALRWTRTGILQLPAFELMMLSAIPFYSLPLLRQHPETVLFPTNVLENAAVCVLLFQLSAITAYSAVRGSTIHKHLWKDPLLNAQQNSAALLGVWASASFSYVEGFTELIPWNYIGLARAVFFGIGIVSVFILSKSWGEGALPWQSKAAFALGLGTQFFLMISGLYLINATSLILLAFAGYITSSRRLPIVTLLAFSLLIAVLHNGKSEMRRVHWSEGQRERVEFSNLPQFFQQWIEHGLAFSKTEEKPVTRSILERASLFHILCVIVDRTPSLVPHLEGETYRSIPLLLIPRFIWADRPLPHDSNRLLAIHYGFSTSETVNNVSIAFGQPAEAYANFGTAGLILVGLFLGAFYKLATVATQGAEPLSFAGLTSILIVAWSFQAEMTLAVWLSSLYQALIAVVAAPMAIKIAFNR